MSYWLIKLNLGFNRFLYPSAESNHSINLWKDQKSTFERWDSGGVVTANPIRNANFA